jgi:hypothetical protein
MIRITDSAKEYLNEHSGQSDDRPWILFVTWDRGNADNSRTVSGEVVWKRAQSRGWVVQHFRQLRDSKEPLPEISVAPGIFVYLNPIDGPAVKSGEIDVEDGKIVFRGNAV